MTKNREHNKNACQHDLQRVLCLLAASCESKKCPFCARKGKTLEESMLWFLLGNWLWLTATGTLCCFLGLKPHACQCMQFDCPRLVFLSIIHLKWNEFHFTFWWKQVNERPGSTTLKVRPSYLRPNNKPWLKDQCRVWPYLKRGCKNHNENPAGMR